MSRKTDKRSCAHVHRLCITQWPIPQLKPVPKTLLHSHFWRKFSDTKSYIDDEYHFCSHRSSRNWLTCVGIKVKWVYLSGRSLYLKSNMKLDNALFYMETWKPHDHYSALQSVVVRRNHNFCENKWTEQILVKLHVKISTTVGISIFMVTGKILA